MHELMMSRKALDTVIEVLEAHDANSTEVASPETYAVWEQCVAARGQLGNLLVNGREVAEERESVFLTGDGLQIVAEIFVDRCG